jgi:hypothetical protein
MNGIFYPKLRLNKIQVRPVAPVSPVIMFSKTGESKLIREVIFPLIERFVDLIFASTLVLAPGFLILAGVFLFQRAFALAALFLLMALAAGVGVYARMVAPYRLRARGAFRAGA